MPQFFCVVDMNIFCRYYLIGKKIGLIWQTKFLYTSTNNTKLLSTRKIPIRGTRTRVSARFGVWTSTTQPQPKKCRVKILFFFGENSWDKISIENNLHNILKSTLHQTYLVQSLNCLVHNSVASDVSAEYYENHTMYV
jgi:hypothetical protein